MSTLKNVTLFFLLLILSACASKQSLVHVHPRHEHYHSSAADTIQNVQVGEYIFREADLSIVDGIELLSPVTGKSTSLLSPNFVLYPNTVLVKSYSKGKYYYYIAKTKKGFKEYMVNAVAEGLTGLRRFDYAGIKQLANTNQMELFAVAQEREYTYPFPESAKWKKVQLHAQEYCGNENSLIYLGKKNGKLAFGHKKYTNVSARKNSFYSKQKSETIEKIIEISEVQKSFTVDGRRIEIMEANYEKIQFRLGLDQA